MGVVYVPLTDKERQWPGRCKIHNYYISEKVVLNICYEMFVLTIVKGIAKGLND